MRRRLSRNQLGGASVDTSARTIRAPRAGATRDKRAGWGVGTYLVTVVLSGLIPLAMFAGYLSYDSAARQLETIRISIISTTRALAVAVDEHVRVRRDML